MKSTWLLLFGIVIGALGSGTYLATVKTDSAVGQSSVSAAEGSTQPERRPRKALFSDWNPNKGTKSKTLREKSAAPTGQDVAKATDEPKPEAQPRPSLTSEPRPLGGADEPTADELKLAAERIEARANRELARLTRLLELTEEQQDRIFPLLARSSTAYHPALAIQVGDAEAGDPTDLPPQEKVTTDAEPDADPGEPLLAKKAADEEIFDVLTDDQKEAYEEELVDDDLWWTEIIDDLEDELDEVVASEVEDGDTGYTGNTGLGNLLQQAAEAAAQK